MDMKMKMTLSQIEKIAIHIANDLKQYRYKKTMTNIEKLEANITRDPTQTEGRRKEREEDKICDVCYDSSLLLFNHICICCI